MNAQVGELITAGSTNETQLVVTNANGLRKLKHKIRVVAVTSGGVKFGIGGVNANAYSYTAGVELTVECKRGELYFKSDHASNTFAISVESI